MFYLSFSNTKNYTELTVQTIAQAISTKASGNYRTNIILFHFSMSSVVASTNHPTSGDADIDRVRAEVRESKTTADNYELRGFLMKLWVVALQQQGAMMEDFMRIDQGLSRIVFWNTRAARVRNTQASKWKNLLCSLTKVTPSWNPFRTG